MSNGNFDDVNKVQRNIHIRHQKTDDNLLAWLQEQGNLGARSFCDAASDLSVAMVQEAERRAGELGSSQARSAF